MRVLDQRKRVIDDIFQLFQTAGEGAYFGEPVSLTEHMVQSAYAAMNDDASPSLVAAALLHDIGHLLHDMPEDIAEQGGDTAHEDLGNAYLQRYFPPAVTEPVRLHVAAKRYLCSVDPAYLSKLSPASLLSLRLQGGPMNRAEVTEFEASPYAEDAVRLRGYDDIAKEAGLEVPPVNAYRQILEACLR